METSPVVKHMFLYFWVPLAPPKKMDQRRPSYVQIPAAPESLGPGPNATVAAGSGCLEHQNGRKGAVMPMATASCHGNLSQ